MWLVGRERLGPRQVGFCVYLRACVYVCTSGRTHEKAVYSGLEYIRRWKKKGMAFSLGIKLPPANYIPCDFKDHHHFARKTFYFL